MSDEELWSLLYSFIEPFVRELTKGWRCQSGDVLRLPQDPAQQVVDTAFLELVNPERRRKLLPGTLAPYMRRRVEWRAKDWLRREFGCKPKNHVVTAEQDGYTILELRLRLNQLSSTGQEIPTRASAEANKKRVGPEHVVRGGDTVRFSWPTIFEVEPLPVSPNSDEVRDLFAGLADDGPSPEEEATWGQVLSRCLQTLDPDDRKILQASADGVTPQEIADWYGITVNAVYIRLHRARQRLEKCLAGQGIEV